MKKRSETTKKKMSPAMAALLGKKAAEPQEDLGFAGKWYDGLNPEQVRVVDHQDGPCAVHAAAGSGKTEALSRRIARMVAGGISPSKILAVTFTKKGGDEMTARITKKFGVAGARVGTWHSFCLQVLREGQTEYAHWTIQDSAPGTNPKMVLKDVLGWKGMNWKNADLALLERFISNCKANLFTPDSSEALDAAKLSFGWEAQRACEAFHNYNEALREKALLTFDDYLVFAADHLANEDNRLRWASRYSHVLQDEYQDANRAQKVIAERLCRDHRNYMAIGDVFQSIYGFRGSKPEYLADFDKEWPGAEVIKLPRNYRSGKKIIEVANKILAGAQVNGFTAEPMVGERELEGEVRVRCAEALDDEANEISAVMLRSVENGETKFSDHTVLYRTNAQSRSVEEALLARRIPYTIVGGISFYERREVRDLLAYLRLATGVAKLEDIKRSINTPFRFLGNAFVGRIEDAVDGRNLETVEWPAVIESVARGAGIQQRQKDSAHEWANIVRTMRSLIEKGALEGATEDDKRDARPAQLLEYVIKTTRYIDWLNREEGGETTEDSAAANVREMTRVAERFSTAEELLGYIGETIRAAREMRKDNQAGGERVLLMSIHRAKGLEWPHVYVVGLNEMVLPHAKGDDQEERRLAYVAVTRARDVLHLSYVRRIATRAGIRDVAPSRFLVETGLPLDGPRGTVDAAILAAATAGNAEDLLSSAAELETQAAMVAAEEQ